MLFLLSAVMLVGSYVAGIIPLIVQLSEVRVHGFHALLLSHKKTRLYFRRS